MNQSKCEENITFIQGALLQASRESSISYIGTLYMQPYESGSLTHRMLLEPLSIKYESKVRPANSQCLRSIGKD